MEWIPKWILYPEKCPHGYDDCDKCGPFEECVEYFKLVLESEDHQRVISGEWPEW